MDSAKRSVLLSIVGIIAAIGLMVGAGFGIARRVGDSVADLDHRVVADIESSQRLFNDLENFDSISTVGGWSLILVPGEIYSVDVSANRKALEQIDVFTRGDTLHLELKSGVQSVTGDLRATVTMRDLEEIRSEGKASLVMSGFDLDELSIDVDGAASLTSNGGSIARLEIESDGASTFDFSGTPVVDALVNMDGASNLDILMAGGELAGVLRGVGNVTFSGDVSTENIDVDGLGRVHRN